MTHTCTNRKSESTAELPIMPLTNGIPAGIVFLIGGSRRLSRDGETILVDIDGDILFLHTREVEFDCYEVVFCVFLDVDPVGNSQVRTLRMWKRNTYLGMKGLTATSELLCR
jgi:hypothetical protein